MEDLQRIIDQEASRHMDCIEDAVDASMKRITRLAAYEDFQGTLVRQAIRERIHWYRHQIAVISRRENGGYDVTTKVQPTGVLIETTEKTTKTLFTYPIDGRTLGAIRGDELAEVAASEAARADGHEFNARLCRALVSKVSSDKLVCQCVKEAELKRIFERLQRRASREAA